MPSPANKPRAPNGNDTEHENEQEHEHGRSTLAVGAGRGPPHFFAVVGGLAHGDGKTGGRPESLRVRCNSISETRMVGATVLTGTKPLSAPQ